MPNPRILILGAGPTGLGAAWRLAEVGYTNWMLLEKSSQPGGLSSSITDSMGFTWDLGGHVQFSHYDYFDKVMDELLSPEEWLYHQRESWIWIRDRFVPYPFQMNLHRLPPSDQDACLRGLEAVMELEVSNESHSFGRWIDHTFGQGISELFMRPYNFKVWGYSPDELSSSWTSDRVAPIDLNRVRNNISSGKDDVSWGPNKTFRFPRRGGTGSIWKACGDRLPAQSIQYASEVDHCNTRERWVGLRNGDRINYDFLLSTIPLDQFLSMSDQPELAEKASRLKYSSTHIVGIGLKGQPPEALRTKCWMYFPESNCPFYRVTVFSNYSPCNVPDADIYWSLMAEVSETSVKPVPPSAILLEDVIKGMINTRLISHRECIVDTWQVRLQHGYPIPSLERDDILNNILPRLNDLNIGSRGRFGAWRYEVSNQDHSFMQGVEWVDHVLNGSDEVTVWYPDKVNAPRS